MRKRYKNNNNNKWKRNNIYNNNDYYYVKHMCNARIRHDARVPYAFTICVIKNKIKIILTFVTYFCSKIFLPLRHPQSTRETTIEFACLRLIKIIIIMMQFFFHKRNIFIIIVHLCAYLSQILYISVFTYYTCTL